MFVQRLIACDAPQEAVDKLLADGVNSLFKLAFCTNYQPSMPDESPLVNSFKATISPDADISAGVMSSLRRAFYEAHTFMLNDLRGKIEKKYYAVRLPLDPSTIRMLIVDCTRSRGANFP